MAKTKYIVPVVAMMLCVVSLIGAGYAAWTSTLTDNETTSADNEYVTLTVGTHTVGTAIDLQWNYAATYTNGATPTQTWTLVENQKVLLLSFSVAKTEVNASSENYTLATSALTVAGISTGVSLKVYSDAEMTSEVTPLTAMAYGTTYHIALVYTSGAPAANSAPASTAAITYTLTPTANSITAA